MLSKTLVREQLEKLPDKFSVEELIERMILIDKIQIGIEQSDKDEIVSEEELDNEIESWFK